MTDIFEEMEHDARARLVDAPAQGAMERMVALGQEAWRIQDWMDRATELMKERGARLKEIFERELVDVMDEAKTDNLGLPEQGLDIKLKPYYKAGLPNPDTAKTDEDRERMATLRAGGLAWLEEHAPGLINTTITITLPKGSLVLAQRIRAELVARYEAPNEEGLIPLPPDKIAIEEGVHWATLTSFVKEQTEANEVLPLNLLGAVVGRICQFAKRKIK